jgi:hypothetical protein
MALNGTTSLASPTCATLGLLPRGLFDVAPKQEGNGIAETNAQASRQFAWPTT